MGGTRDPKDDKAARLSEALRANLRRRKAQAKARKTPTVETSADTAPTRSPETDNKAP